MPFSPVPAESKSQINKAGALLAKGTATAEEQAGARSLAERWRACHAYPINTFQARLRIRLKRGGFGGKAMVAQRLKRMPTIIDKLARYPAMNLTTMQDIGGIRAVLNSVTDVRKLVDEIKKGRPEHELINEKDYIQEPRNEDGYRSVHLIYRYKSKTPMAQAYCGLKLELQIRTKLQHTWATAVETMGTFLGQALKSRKGDKEWLDFFSLVASAIAYQEGTPPVPQFAGLSEAETLKKIAEAEASLDALEKMRGFSVAVKTIVDKARGERKSEWFYYLIMLDSLAHRVRIRPFSRTNFKAAEEEYSRLESESAAKGEKVEYVLVSAENVRKAYPNFFLDMKDFSDMVKAMIAASKR